MSAGVPYRGSDLSYVLRRYLLKGVLLKSRRDTRASELQDPCQCRRGRFLTGLDSELW
jgi:hypothetical protein